MSNLQEEYESLAEEISIGATADGELKVTEFFNIFSELAAENGDCPDLEYAPIVNQVGYGYRVDGFAFDIPEDAEAKSGDLYIAVCDFHQAQLLPTLNAKDIDKVAAGAERFIRIALSPRSLDEMEEASPAYRLAIRIQDRIDRIARIRLIVLTNAHLRTKKKYFPERQLGEVVIQTNVLDIERYVRIASFGTDPVEVNFTEDFSGAVSCLPASVGKGGYSSYLFALHGPILAKIFATFGNRLLDQNVRTYLQAKTGVNRGILKTIADEPSMFFAYNNGLTATASFVETQAKTDGSVGVSRIVDFQIVNGGQTTASLLYARDALKLDLSDVFVQCKLSVVGEDQLAEVVPRISTCANTQNKVSLADLAANSPAQIKIERLSKEVNVPRKAGALHASRWFYERSRGQYKNMFAYKSATERRRLELEFPKSHLLEKTDLAKFELSFSEYPHHVSEGAQKCFARFAKGTLEQIGNTPALNEVWFRFAVAKGILFLELDRCISQSTWYRNSKGLKAQTVAYTIAATAHSFRKAGWEVDLDRIWRQQEVPLVLMEWMLALAERIHGVLTDPPGSVKDAGEFCKKEFCWELHVKPILGIPGDQIIDFGVRTEDLAAEKAQGRRDEKRSVELDFEIQLARLVPKAAEIRREAAQRNLLSEGNERAIRKLEAGKLNFNKGEKVALKSLLERLDLIE